MYEFTVTEQHDNRMIRSILQSQFKMSSRYIRRIVEERGLTVNGKPMYLTNRVKVGDVIEVKVPKEQSSVLSEPMDLDIRYEDHEVVVVNKPPGRLTHPSARERWGSMLAGVQAYLDDDGLVPHSVHRLDRDTSGLVMFAKHAHAHHLFDLALQAGDMHRSYCALVYDGRHETRNTSRVDPANTDEESQIGVWRTIDKPIGISEEMFSRRVIDEEGQDSITHYRILGRAGGIAFVELSLETGRTHQIRLHMSSIGMPLVGDKDYQGALDASYKATLANDVDIQRLMKRQALHAFRLAWKHPVTHERHVAEAAPPEDMRHTWETLGGDMTVFQTILRDPEQLSPPQDF